MGIAQEERVGSRFESKPFAILLVEDNEADIFMITEVLKRSEIDFNLQVATDGAEALAFFEIVEDSDSVECPALVLLDLNLPKVSGIELLKQIRRNSRCNRVPVVIVSSSDSPAEIETNALYHTAYFLKPTNVAAYMKLGNIIREALSIEGR